MESIRAKSSQLIALVAILAGFASCSSNESNSAASGGQSGGTPSAGGGGSGNSGGSGAASGSGGRGGSLSAGGLGAAGAQSGGGSAGTSASAGRGGSGEGGKSVSGGGGTTAGAATTGGAGASSGGTAGSGGSLGGGGSTAGAGASGASAGAAGAAGSGGGAAYSPCPTDTAKACAVLPLGDSITEGFGSSGGGYRVELFRKAVQASKNLTFVGSLQNGPDMVENKPFPKRHQGHGGYAIDSGQGHSGISGQITQKAISDYQPHIVLLMIGTNDINGNFDVADAPTRLGRLIDDIVMRAPDALVVVATIIPIANDGTNQRVKTYNAAIPALVSSRAAAGKHVVLLDIYAAFSQDPNFKTALMGDNLHPNNAGYAVLGSAFYDTIAPALP